MNTGGKTFEDVLRAAFFAGAEANELGDRLELPWAERIEREYLAWREEQLP